MDFVINKELTIKEIFRELKILEYRLINIDEKRVKVNINVSAVTWKDIVTKGGKKGDIMLNKQIKKDELKDEFEMVKESYDAYKELAIKKIREMLATKPVDECIVYFRDELHWDWKSICKLFNYGRSQANKKYNDFKNRTTSDTIGH